MNDIAIILSCYLVGSIPFGLVLSKVFKKDDPRNSGSKNIGATNIYRLHGKWLGLITLICDFLKAFIPLLIIEIYVYELVVLGSISIFMGHIYPFWLKFKGGKGIAVFIGILLKYSISLFVTFTLVWIIIFFIFRYSSLAALVSCFAILCLSFFYLDIKELMSVILINFFIFLKHKDNINRLLKGSEKKIYFQR